jgi:hypothetical protein
MFCPKCRNEYREGVVECYDCRIPLVESLPPESKTFPWPKPSHATLLVIAGITYTFILRNVGTFVPDVFTNLATARITSLGSFLATLTVVLFFATFFARCISEDQTGLRCGAKMAIIGSGMMSLLNLKDLLRLFNVRSSLIIIDSHYIEIFVPWVASFFMLFFFISLYKVSDPVKENRLKRAAMIAGAGSIVSVLMSSLTLVNFFLFDEFKPISDIFAAARLLFFPVVILSFAAVLYFFLTFYREQKITV